MSDINKPEQPAPFVAPTSAVPSSPSMPDIADLVRGSKGRKEPRAPISSGGGLSRNLVVGAVVGGVVLAGGGFFAGQATASGPKSLYAAVQEASAGKLPCGTSDATTGASALIARLCGSTGGSIGGPTGGGTAGGGFGGGGGAFGRGVSGTVTSISSGSITVNTRAGAVTVVVPGTVGIEKTIAGALTDVTVGATVTITSTTDSSGNRTASRITIVPAGSLPTGGGFGGGGGIPGG